MGHKPPIKAQQRHVAPPISDELLAYLDRLYPEKCPDPKTAERDIWIAVGRREVVRALHQEAAVQRRPT